MGEMLDDDKVVVEKKMPKVKDGEVHKVKDLVTR